VIQEISYRPERITYRKYDRGSTERFKIGHGTPASAKGATMKWEAAAKVVDPRIGRTKRGDPNYARRPQITLPEEYIPECNAL